MTEKQNRMLGWMKASCVWSIVTGVGALVLVAIAGSYAKYFEDPRWLYLAILVLVVFGAMQVIDGLVRLDYNNKLVWALEDKVNTKPATDVEEASAKLHGRTK